MATEQGEYHELLRLGFEMDISFIQVLAIVKNTSNSFKPFFCLLAQPKKPFQKRKTSCLKMMQNNASSINVELR